MSGGGIKLIVAGSILVVAVLFLGLRLITTPKKSDGSEMDRRIEVSETLAGDAKEHSEKFYEAASITVDESARLPELHLKPPQQGRRKYSAAIKKVRELFGGDEAARATLLTERLNGKNTSYLYVVEPPSAGEVQTVKAQIADLRKEVSPEDLEKFDTRLENEMKSYDPYGDQGRKVLLITVPVDRAARMSGSVLAATDPEGLKHNFESGEPYSVTVLKAWVASYDGNTLERFDQLLVWEPEVKE